MKRTKKNYEESVVRSLIPGHVSASLVRPGTGRHWGLGGGGGAPPPPTSHSTSGISYFEVRRGPARNWTPRLPTEFFFLSLSFSSSAGCGPDGAASTVRPRRRLVAAAEDGEVKKKIQKKGGKKGKKNLRKPLHPRPVAGQPRQIPGLVGPTATATTGMFPCWPY